MKVFFPQERRLAPPPPSLHRSLLCATVWPREAWTPESAASPRWKSCTWKGDGGQGGQLRHLDATKEQHGTQIQRTFSCGEKD